MCSPETLSPDSAALCWDFSCFVCFNYDGVGDVYMSQVGGGGGGVCAWVSASTYRIQKRAPEPVALELPVGGCWRSDNALNH